MLTAEENKKLTEVGPGTPGGELLRRYWHPVAGASELESEPVLGVRLLGEDLVLFRDLSGKLGLLEAACCHRKVSLVSGIPQEQGIRCCYHGWLYDCEGKCIEQPAEPTFSRFKDAVGQRAYVAQELGGLIWAYMGPLPAPLIPALDVLVHEDAWRDIGKAVIPCNWVQCIENSVDLTHVDYLHGLYYDYVLRRQGREPLPKSDRVFGGRKQVEIGFDKFKFGIKKRRRLEGDTENAEWQVGANPLIFPTMTRAGGRGSLQIRVPVDDVTTLTFLYSCSQPDDGLPVPPQESIPVYDVPLYDENGKWKTDWVTGQDIMAWVLQGPIMDRSTEQLGASDIGIKLIREMIFEEIDAVANGNDPYGTVRDPSENLPFLLQINESGPARRTGYMDNHWHQFSPIYGELKALMSRPSPARTAMEEEAKKKKEASYIS